MPDRSGSAPANCANAAETSGATVLIAAQECPAAVRRERCRFETRRAQPKLVPSRRGASSMTPLPTDGSSAYSPGARIRRERLGQRAVVAETSAMSQLFTDERGTGSSSNADTAACTSLTRARAPSLESTTSTASRMRPQRFRVGAAVVRRPTERAAIGSRSIEQRAKLRSDSTSCWTESPAETTEPRASWGRIGVRPS